MNHDPYNERFAQWLQDQMDASGHTIARLVAATGLSKTTIVGLTRALLPISGDVRKSFEGHFGAVFEVEEHDVQSARGTPTSSMDHYLTAPGYTFCQRNHRMPIDGRPCPECGGNEAPY